VVEHEPFGSDVEQAELTAVEAGEAGAGLAGGEGGVEIGRGYAGSSELRDLIVHERDEWRDDDGEAAVGPDERGELKAHRLAAAGGQDGEDIATAEMRFDDLALERTEAVVAEGGAESVEEQGKTKDFRRCM